MGDAPRARESDIQTAFWEYLNAIPVWLCSDQSHDPHVVGDGGCGDINAIRPNLSKLADFCYHVPNGIWLPGATPAMIGKLMSSLKRQGFRNGVSDIVIALPMGQYHGAYLELKRGEKEVRAMADDQRHWLERMARVGYYAGVASCFEEAVDHMHRYVRKQPMPALPWASETHAGVRRVL